MGKNKTNLIFYYDEDFDEEHRPKRKFKPRKKEPGLVFDESSIYGSNPNKQKVEDRRLNKQKDKNKHDKFEDWN